MKFLSGLTLFAALPLASAAGGVAAAKSPVERVVKLMEELKANLLRDQKVEQQIYDKFACWCENSMGAKAARIELLHMEIFKITQEVLELKGTVAVLAGEIAELSGKIAKNEEQIKEQTAIRSKENGEYMTEKQELEEAIDALERAIKVLSGVGAKTGLLQGSTAENEAFRLQAMVSVRSVINALPRSTNLSPKQLAAIESIAKELQEPAGDSASYTPASATVQGILKDMYDSFTADLESQTQAEAEASQEYEEAIHGLVEQINGNADENVEGYKEIIVKKEEEKAEAAQKLADTVQELDDSKKQLDADIKWFDQTKGACKAKNEEWTARKEARLEEIEGIGKALEILTSDEARELFARATSSLQETMFVQLHDISSNAAMKAYEALKAQATKAHSLRLAALAATVREMGLGHFDKVIEKIDEMIQTLKEEEKDDIKQRDWCKDEYHENAEEKAELKWLIKNNDAKIEKLQKMIDKLTEEIAATVEEIEETEKQIKQMEETRKSEHEEFKVAKKDDEAAIKLLDKTVEVLGKYYKDNKIEMIEMGPIEGSTKLLQEPEFERSEWDAPDATFNAPAHRKNQSKGIIGIITIIIEDLKSEISNGIKDEVAAQMEFEKQVDAAKQLIKDLTDKKDNLERDKADAEQKQDDEEEDKKNNEEDLQKNEDYMVGPKGIKPDCDWMLNSFEERIQKRKAEMNGLVTAKEYLTGSTPPAMMQSSSTFDDNTLGQIGFERLRR